MINYECMHVDQLSVVGLRFWIIIVCGFGNNEES